MDTTSLEHLMTDEERAHFEDQGYLHVENALDAHETDALLQQVDALHTDALDTGKTKPGDSWGKADIVGLSDPLLNLVDNPRVLPKVWGALGWNIMLYHSHLHVKPPAPDADEGEGWMEFHQDSGRVNLEMRTFPQARISLKVAHFLTDVSEPGRGNFYIIPGSHLSGAIPISSEIGRDPAEATSEGIPEGAIPVCAKPGTAVLFDRRLWHGRSANQSDLTRKVIFYGYSYRWIQPKDSMTVEQHFDRIDSIRRQLLGHVTNNNGRYVPKDDDVPLRGWLIEHLGEEAVAAMDAPALVV
jgi:ectoine hydroxylase